MLKTVASAADQKPSGLEEGLSELASWSSRQRGRDSRHYHEIITRRSRTSLRRVRGAGFITAAIVSSGHSRDSAVNRIAQRLLARIIGQAEVRPVHHICIAERGSGVGKRK